MKTKLLILTLSLALASFVARAQDSHLEVMPFKSMGYYKVSNIHNLMRQRDGNIVIDVYVAHSDDPHGNDPIILGHMLYKVTSTDLRFIDSLFIADTLWPYCFGRNPHGQGNIRTNIEPDGEGNMQLRISHFSDDDLNVIGADDVVVPLCEGEAFGHVLSDMIDCQGNLILKYYKETSPDVYEGHIARFALDGTLLYDTLIPSNQNFINTMEVFNESPLEYCQWRRGGDRNLNFFVLDSTFQLKNNYVISKVINEASSPWVQEYFEFNSSNSNSTFVVPDGEDVLVAARYERFAEGEVPEYGVAAARYNLRTMQRKVVQFNDYPGTDSWADCFGFQKMPDGSVYLLYRERGMPVKYWMTVVKMDSDLNVEWKRYCETPDGMTDVEPYGTYISKTIEDNGGNVIGLIITGYSSRDIDGGLFYGVLTPNGIDAVAEAGIEVRPYMFYPNPAQDRLRLQYSPDVDPAKIELYDLQGRLVRSQGSAFESVDMGQLPTGTYTLRVIMDDGQVFTDKVVKE